MKLNEAYKAKFGHNLYFKDCYRDIKGQQQARTDWCNKGACEKAAKPGTSNHGWGLALDLRPTSGREMTYGSEEYKWLMENAPNYGWVNPPSMQQGGSNEEPWHWEYARPADYNDSSGTAAA